MLSAFLDGVFSRAVGPSRTVGASVTVHLSVDFLSIAKAGRWIIGESWVTRRSRDLIFVEGRIHSAGRDVVRGSGIFKLIGQAGA
jgi:acyl-coenzyme A thioesterase PaaI-like protein